MTDLSKLAASLSEAQRRIILRARPTLFGEHFIIGLRNRWDSKVVTNLEAKGVFEAYPANLNSRQLTTLGLALRDHIRQENGDDAD